LCLLSLLRLLMIDERRRIEMTMTFQRLSLAADSEQKRNLSMRMLSGNRPGR
jgi:hypothetical protein